MSGGKKEKEQPSRFSVSVENPQNIYRHLSNQMPFLVDAEDQQYSEDIDPADLPSCDAIEDLSSTILDGSLFSDETTWVEIDRGIGREGLIGWDLHSIIFFQVKKTPLTNFYSSERVSNIKSLLRTKGFDVNSSVNRMSNLYVYNKERNIAVDVDFGYSSLKDLMLGLVETDRRKLGLTKEEYSHLATKFLDNPNYEEREAIQEKAEEQFISEKVEPAISRMNISLTLFSSNKEGQIGVLEFPEDEQSFVESVRFYARTYEQVLKALYQEAGLSLPQNPVVLKLPYTINTRLRLD
ncbi:MAG: hypothetical protein A2857_00730 [Candidatus Levybacteria bacterium RIFCSPHIGHO2_01_FULL_36_15]|nr:MAG: hypothetical protein A2857_00730 [Candidatus Levybacteria bacterium RIFCSPHIGHO2_01_FULL_36_15]OGH37216.1 MAG: hypothetical protein A2905_04555 [Candidatus Levybacteria bacterium RIFCSPLOWO2_01_FULL_36_10]